MFYFIYFINIFSLFFEFFRINLFITFQVKTILNVAPILPAMPDSLFTYADIVIANETELERLSGSSTDSIDQIEAAAKSIISKKGIKEVIVTLGEKVLINFLLLLFLFSIVLAFSSSYKYFTFVYYY